MLPGKDTGVGYLESEVLPRNGVIPRMSLIFKILNPSSEPIF